MIGARIFLIFTVFLSLGFNHFLSRTIDDEFVPYYNEFMGYVEEGCKEDEYFFPRQFSITFGDTEKSENIGLCRRSNIRFMITIKKSFWDDRDEEDRFSLIMHELTHCILLADHVDDPEHYMNTFFRKVSRQTVINQLKSYIKDNCSNE